MGKSSVEQDVIHIFGDSFSSNAKGWPSLGKTFGTNGASEYRIFRSFRESPIVDKVIICHTHWSRVFLKDTNRSLMSRALASHPFCDILGNDILEKQEKEFLSTLSTIWDEQYLKDTYWLMVDQMLSHRNAIHITFFEDIDDPRIHNLHGIWQANRGSINHMNSKGNAEVIEFLRPYLE